MKLIGLALVIFGFVGVAISPPLGVLLLIAGVLITWRAEPAVVR